MSSQMERRAANARRAAAERAGERGGQSAYDRFKTRAPGLGSQRWATLEIRPEVEEVMRGGKPAIHTWGYFTVYGRPYPMWDDYGRYDEWTEKGSGSQTLAVPNLDANYLLNHEGTAMARTRNGSLLLREDATGGWHDAYLNPDRPDCQIVRHAIDDEDIDQMSFGFIVPEGGGGWTDDFMGYAIRTYDMDRGHVAPVNYGANPYTSIAARSYHILNQLDKLPLGAKQEARDRLSIAEQTRLADVRERITVRSRQVDTAAAPAMQRLQASILHTSERMVALAQDADLTVADLPTVRLPWFEFHHPKGHAEAADQPTQPDEEPGPDEGDDTSTSSSGVDIDITTIFIFDEIGGSFGVGAQEFVDQLEAVQSPLIFLRINSPGGVINDAITMANAIRHVRDRGKHVRAFVDGMAASAATLIAVAANEVVMMPGSQFMVHMSSASDQGTAKEKRQMGLFLDKQDRNAAAMYAAKAGGTTEDWLEIMDAETWYLDSETVDAKLADRLWSPATRMRNERACADPRMTRKWDLTGRYRYQGREAAPRQQRRSLDQPRLAPRLEYPAEKVDGGRTVDQAITDLFARGGLVADEAEAQAQPEPQQSGSTQAAPRGRSISLIMAGLEADGFETD